MIHYVIFYIKMKDCYHKHIVGSIAFLTTHLVKRSIHMDKRKKMHALEKTALYIPIMPLIGLFKKLSVILVSIMLGLAVGFLVCYWWRPRYIIVERDLYPAKKVAQAVLPDADLDARIRRRAEEMTMELLQACRGILEIKDNEAQTVLHKRAAIGSKNGFIGLKNDTPYVIHHYFLHRNTGYGIAGESAKNIFLIIWHPGAIKPPSANPGAIKVVSGRRIEITSSPSW